MLNAITRNLQYVRGLVGYLRHPLGIDESMASLEQQLARRNQTFLDILGRSVYSNPKSPYLRLLHHAKIAQDDVARLVEDHGLEGALQRLGEAGIYVSMQELKGRQPIVRPGIEFEVDASDFHNPLVPSEYESRSSGSRGARSRLPRNFEWMTEEAKTQVLLDQVMRTWERPLACWRPAIPEPSGVSRALSSAKLSQTTRVWFSPTRLSVGNYGVRGVTRALLTMATFRAMGHALPWPQYTPYDEPAAVVEWLGAMKARGTPAILATIVSPAVRLAIAAIESGTDISGTTIRVAGEPLTPSKAALIAKAGIELMTSYSMSEIGNIGYGCAEPKPEMDDVHLMSSKLAMIEREVEVSGGMSVRALAFTTLLRANPLVLINAESGDSATVEERGCGCLMGKLGLNTHLSNLRSYEKLTSEGVTYAGPQLQELLERDLPLRFGGSPLDYQLVEQEIGGLPKISLVVAPGVGDIDDTAVVTFVMDWLGRLPDGGRQMADLWSQTGVLEVQRRKPYTTASSKVLPLHVVQPDTTKI